METAADIVADIERKVADGVLRPGDRLPPVRTLADQVGLAPNTVAAAYRALQSRGILIGRGRAGTFVTERPPLGERPLAPVPPGTVDMATGNPDPVMLPDPAQVLGRARPRVLYGEAATDPELAAAMADRMAADGLAGTEPIAVSGALDGMERVLQVHLRTGDRVIVEDPAYASVLDLLGVLGLVPVPVPVDDEGLDPAGLADALAGGATAVVVTPRAQNPYGSAWSGERRANLVHVLERWPDVLVIEDDHAGRVSGANRHSITDPARPRWAYLRSVAKELGPDLRVATLAADPVTQRRVLGRQRVGPGWVSHHLQRAVAALLEDPAVDRLLTDAADRYRERRDRLLDRLAAAGIPAHGRSGLNVWVLVVDEAATVAAMLERGFAVRSGSGFRLRSGPGVRLTVAGQELSTLDAAADALIASADTGTVVRTG